MATTLPAGKPEPLVEMRSIVKHFPGVLANDGANLEVRRGEVHALLGENGAGKTTLMNILSGLYTPDSGEIRIEGRPRTFRSPRDAIQAGIGMVHQHFNLVEVFTAAQNVSIGLPRPRVILRMRETEDELARIGREFGLQVDPRALIWQLSVGEQQRVEILKMLYRNARLLILDEPTAVLAPQEADQLGDTLRKMAASGRSVLYISHKLGEVLGLADRITVLRAGRNVATVNAADVDEKQLARLMVGDQAMAPPARGRRALAGGIALGIRNLCVRGDRGNQAIRDFSLQLRSGEILGLAGIAGNGQRELAEAIVGLRRIESGSVFVGGVDTTGESAESLIKAGVSLIPENRMEMGLIPALGLYENAILKNYRQPPISRGWLLDMAQIRRYATRLVADFSIRVASLEEPIWKLSGGNLQRLLLGREISSNPLVLVAANPTRGLDIQAATEVRRMLIGHCEAGASVLLISEDLDELVSISDRVAVIYNGQVIGQSDAPATDVDRLGLMMMGSAAVESV